MILKSLLLVEANVKMKPTVMKREFPRLKNIKHHLLASNSLPAQAEIELKCQTAGDSLAAATA